MPELSPPKSQTAAAALRKRHKLLLEKYQAAMTHRHAPVHAADAMDGQARTPPVSRLKGARGRRFPLRGNRVKLATVTN